MGNKIKFYVIACVPFIISFYVSSFYWYNGEWKNELGMIPFFIILVGWSIGLLILLCYKIIEYKPPLKFILILFLSIWIVDAVLTSNKTKILLKYNKKTIAKIITVSHSSRYYRTILKYEYTVNNKKYLKSDNDKYFVEQYKMKEDDSLVVFYNPNDPHSHEFELAIYNSSVDTLLSK